MRNQFDFDSNDKSAIVGIVECDGLISGIYSIDQAGNAWTTAVLTVVYDAGSGVWNTYPDVATLTAAVPTSERLDLTFCARVALKVSTPEGSSSRLFGAFFGKDRLTADVSVQSNTTQAAP